MKKILLSAFVVGQFLGLSLLLAQTTGKIAGTIRDKANREPLMGVNVTVKGTTFGGTTDEKGFFFILRVPPAVYSLEASYMGYAKVTVTGVRVQNDLTTELNVQMEESSVQLGEVVITAEQKMIQKDVTSTRKTVTRETMRETPGIDNTADVFRLQGGVFVSSLPQTLKLTDGVQLQVRDESLKDVHIRGGRGGEILYMVDGMPVTHPIYGGRSVVDLNVADVESVELLTGAFNAEYGQAQSGVLNINTRSGGDKYKGGLEYKTDVLRAFGESYETQYVSTYLGGPEPFSRDIFPALGIELPGTLNFFLSANVTLTNTPYENHRTRSDLNLFGLTNVREKQDNTQNLNGKLTWEVTPEYKFALSYHGSWKAWSEFNWPWKYYPDRQASYERNNEAMNIQFTNVLSKSTYLTLNFGYLGVTYNGSWDNRNPASFWHRDTSGRYVTTASLPVVDPSTGFYDNRGFENIWRDDKTKTFTFKADFTSQMHPAHLVKIGVQIGYNDINYIDIQDGGLKLSQYGLGESLTPPPGPFPEFGQNRWVFHVKPTIGSAYIQDKFELEYLILNYGIRSDFLLLGSEVMQEAWKSRWEFATGQKANWSELIYKFSPRFGISFPISENTVLFFSYGHFNQTPELQYYYRDPYSGTYTGNPKLDFEQTILYEFGLTHQLTDNWAIDVKSYAKDISRQIGSTTVYDTSGFSIDLYDNKGYARARGLEFELTKSPMEMLSGRITYTVQWTYGYSSSAFDDYIRSTTNFPYPIRERSLAWDVRHQVIATISLASRENDQHEIFGIDLPNDWNLNLLYRFSTGNPYTPGEATTNPVETQKRENTATGPPFSSTDLKFEKGFTVGGVRLALTMDIFNLFDERNIQMGYGFDTWTGKPFVYGDVQKPQSNFFDYYTMLSIMDPRQFSTARTTKIGLRVDF
jgi:outer membrane receptor protein involved in Fe transport